MPANPNHSGADQQVPEAFAATNLESDEDIRKALQARRARQSPAAKEVPVAKLADDEPAPERPTQRPPVAMLCVLDDGKLDGEWFRLRSERTVIGRTEGDIRIPHDGQISTRHAELVRQRVANGYRWALVDLGSTNGTFVRFGSTLLRHENEVTIGRSRFRFEAGLTPSPAPAGAPQQTTQAWTESPLRGLVSSWVELGAAGPVNRVALTLAGKVRKVRGRKVRGRSSFLGLFWGQITGASSLSSPFSMGNIPGTGLFVLGPPARGHPVSFVS